MTLNDVTVVIVPGLREHVPGHWQALLAKRLPKSRTVEPLVQDRLSLAARVAALQDTIASVQGPIVLAAHSAGVIITAHWAQAHRCHIVGALLATPPDMEEPMPEAYPKVDELRATGWLPVPRQPLPFPSIVAGSRNDPLAQTARVISLARDWGSRFIDLGPVGHLNPAAGYGEWPMAFDLLHLILDLPHAFIPGVQS